jgi:hypothetical protein
LNLNGKFWTLSSKKNSLISSFVFTKQGEEASNQLAIFYSFLNLFILIGTQGNGYLWLPWFFW